MSLAHKCLRSTASRSLIAALLVAVACGGHDETRIGTQHGAIVGDDDPLPVPDTIVSPNVYATNGHVVDSLPGSSSVDATGQARYSIPLWVPPGRAGMQPAISLEYYSRGDNGLLGVGWQVSGLSSITRCPHTVATDGYAGPIKFDDTDAYCLDGQHLKQVGSRSNGVLVFHTERDIFADAILTPTPDGPSFTVYRKDGRIDDYVGYKHDRKTNANWYISKSRDHYNNTISYAYDVSLAGYGGHAADAVYLRSIDYTGSEDKIHPLLPNRHIKFGYDKTPGARPDPEFSGASGALNMVGRMSAIEMWGPGVDAQQTQTMFRRYAFTFATQSSDISITHRSLLRTITTSDAAGNTLQTTDLKWEQGSMAFNRFDSSVTDYAKSDDLRGLQLNDINQDGFADLVYVTKDSSGNSEYAIRLWDPGTNDFGARFEPNLKPSKDRWGQFTFPRVALSDSGSIGMLLWGNPTGTNWSEPHPIVQQVRTNPNGTLYAAEYVSFDPTSDLVVAADLDGDGLADILSGWTKIPTPQFSFSRNLAQGNVAFAPGVAITASTGGVKPMGGTPRPMRLLDLDGDNKQEMAVCAGYQAYIVTNNAATPYTTFDGYNPSSRGLVSCDPTYKALHADFNGDGLDDIFYPEYGPIYPMKVFNYGPRTILDNSAGVLFDRDGAYGNNSDKMSYQVMDFDLDGRPDILNILVGSAASVTNGAHGTGLNPVGFSPPFYPTSDLAVGDVNGDGFDDIVQQEANGLAIYVRQGKKPDMLTSVVDGFGNKTTFTYQPINNAAVYTPGTVHYAYPLRNVAGGIWVVSTHEVANGINTKPTPYSHKYAQGIDDVQRGFQGFNAHSVTWYDGGGSRQRNEIYDNVSRGVFVEPFAGLPTSIDTLFIDNQGKVVHEEKVLNTYSMKWNDAFNVYFPYARIRENDTFDVDVTGALVQSAKQTETVNAIDYYGNVTSALLDNGVSETRDLEITYQYGVTGSAQDLQWLIDEPVQISETSHLNLPPPLHGRTITRRAARQYDNSGGLIWEIQEPDYDSSGRVIPLAQPQPDGVQTKFVHYSRDWDGQLNGISTDIGFTATANQRVRTFFHDASDRVYVSRIKDEVGHVTHLANHPGLGVLAAMQAANGNYSQWSYDTFGRLMSYSPGGSETVNTTYSGYAGAVTYDPTKTSPLITQVGAAGSSTIARLDSKGRAIHTIATTRNDGVQVLIDTTYDEFGRVVSTTRPYFTGNTKSSDTFAYDFASRLHRKQLADGRIEQIDYFGVSNTGLQIDHYDANPTDASVLKTSSLQDLAGRITSSWEHAAAKDGRPARDIKVGYSYGNFDMLGNITNDAGMIAVRFDRLGREIYLADPSRGSRAYTLDVFGELSTESINDINGNVGELRQTHYDNLGRVVDLTTRDGLTKWVWDIAPNGIGQLASTSSPSGVSRQFAYDSQNRLIDETWSVGGGSFDITRVPDDFGRLSKLIYPTVNGGRFTVRYEYGPHSSLQAIKDDATGLPFFTLLERDANSVLTNPSGRFAHYTLGDKLGSVHFNEDPTRPGALKTIRTTTSSVVQSLTYVFDGKGFLQKRTDAFGMTESFDYDELNRLEHWTVNASAAGPSRVRYDYYDVGNVKARVYEAGAGPSVTFDYSQDRGAGPYAVSAAGTKLFGYDVEGNQTQAGTRTVTPAAFGLPLAITDQGTFKFVYDSEEQRVEKTATVGATTNDTITLDGLYQRHSTDGGASDHLYTIVGPFGPVAQVSETDGQSGRTTYYVLGDHLGSADTIIDAAGTLKETRKFDPFGNPIDPKNPLNPAPANTTPVTFGFAGHEHDWDLAIINMKGRLYDPATARFVSADPTVQSPFSAIGLNSYSYALNRPTSLTDPFGFQSEMPPPSPQPSPPGPPGDRQQPPPGSLVATSPPQTSTGGGHITWPNAVDDAGTRAQNNVADRARIFFKSEIADLAEQLMMEDNLLRWANGADYFKKQNEEYWDEIHRRNVLHERGINGTTLGDILNVVTIGSGGKYLIGKGLEVGASLLAERAAASRIAGWATGDIEFAGEEQLMSHLANHGGREFGAKTAEEYLQVGRDIMRCGERVRYWYKPAGEMRTGFIQFMKNSRRGTAQFGFVGTNSKGFITTIHMESGNSMWKMLNGVVDKTIFPW